MKKRKIALILGLGAVTASTLVLTSCGGGKESISFKSYSNKVTEEEWVTAAQAIDVKDYTNYSATSYEYDEFNIKYDDLKSISKEISKTEEKLNVDDKVAYVKSETTRESEDPTSSTVSKRTSENTFQVDGEKLYTANMGTKTYYETSADSFDTIRYQLSLDSEDEDDVSSEVYSFLNISQAPVKYEYYKDDKVFTVTAELDNDKLAEYGTAMKAEISGSFKATFQFYYDENELFYASEGEIDLTTKSTDSENKGFKETTTKVSSANYVSVKFEKPSISKVNISDYKKYNEYY